MQREFQEHPLGQGVTLHVLPTDKFKTTTIKVFIKRQLDEGEVTSTACVPFVLRRGTRDYPTTRAMATYLESLYGAQFGVDIHKVGDAQHVEVGMDIANERFLRDASGLTDAALGFLEQVLFHPALDDGSFRGEYVHQEVEGLRRRIEGLINDKRQYAANRLREEMYSGEPFALHRYGRLEDLEAVEPRALYKHYQRVMQTSAVDIFIVGAVDPAEMAQEAGQRLPFPGGTDGGWERGTNGAVGEPREVTEEQTVQQGVLAMGFRTPIRYADEDYPGLLMYNGIFGGFPHSKLFLNVREKASLAYFASSRMEASQGMIMAMAGIDVANYDQAVEIIHNQADDMVAGRISDEELQATRKALVNGLLSAQDSPNQLIDTRLVGLVNGRVRSPAELVTSLGAVTKDQIAAVAAGIKLDTIYFLRPKRG